MANLAHLLNPKSIAFIGGNECAIAITRTRELGYTGKIWAVHPKRSELGGIATVASVDDILGEIDAAFIAVKREPTIEIVKALRSKGCKGAVIYAAGFAEAGSSDLQNQLLEAAGDMRLMGPNCYGFVNVLGNVALWPDEHGLTKRETGVAIITQSGNIACNLTFTRRQLPLAAIFTLGNQADVEMADMVEALCADPRITAIGLHIEGLKDIAAFAKAAARARLTRKPIVVLKTGKSEQGAKVTFSHTSSLSGADTLYDAMFKRFGIARVNDVASFAETLKFLHHGGPLAETRLVSHSCSGGEAALIADMAVGRGVSFPTFDDTTKPKVSATLNEFVSIDNPLDYHTFIWNDEDRLTATFTATLSGGFDCGVLILDTPTLPHMNATSWYKTARAFIAAAKTNNARAVVVTSLAENMPEDMALLLAENGIAPIIGFEELLTAVECAGVIGANWNLKQPPLDIKSIQPAPGEAKLIGEFAAKQMLAKSGVPIAKSIVCKAVEAPIQATKIGFPVVVKTANPEIAHKTEVSGVVINLTSEAEVAAAVSQMAHLGEDILIEKMVRGAVAELIIGITRDQQFGLNLVVGAGGIFTELLKDSVTVLLPCSDAEISSALKSLKVWKLIEGYRGKSGDKQAVISAVKAICAFAYEYAAEIEELEINPLLVLQHEAVAVDALVRMRKKV